MKSTRDAAPERTGHRHPTRCHRVLLAILHFVAIATGLLSGDRRPNTSGPARAVPGNFWLGKFFMSTPFWTHHGYPAHALLPPMSSYRSLPCQSSCEGALRRDWPPKEDDLVVSRRQRRWAVNKRGRPRRNEEPARRAVAQ